MGFRSEWGAQFPTLTPQLWMLHRDKRPRVISDYHFEFLCRANRIEPTFEMFNVFYFVSYTGGFYSFNSRTGWVSPCSTNPPKSLHEWKQKFFYIHH
ncbi:hypothetical protein Hanom_Chr15g01409881 [Helianthus anomalus]